MKRRRFITSDYLKLRPHGKELAKLMWKLVEAGPLTKPELEHELNWPHSEVQERVDELSRLHYVFSCGTLEKVKRKRGQKFLRVPSASGVPAQLWDLSPAGVYALLVADKEASKSGRK